MKRIASILLFAFAILVTVSSCRKYEEGPNISLRTKKARITNNWRYESAQVDGVEVSSDPYFAKQKHYFYRDGKYIQTIIDPITQEARNLQGNWVLYDNDKKIAVTVKIPPANKDSTNNYSILKLFEKQMWLRTTDNSREYHFAPFE
ncbi:MAG TPA: hypothetical protein PLU17_08860 [Chitinophagaceae bacterium]|nr:hypothetical protein [Chitinophagaceae bacterium]